MQLFQNKQNQVNPQYDLKRVQNYIFKFTQKIGKGNFSTVYKGIDSTTNEKVAIKIIEMQSLKSPRLKELLTAQINILKRVKHKNVINCKQILFSSKNCYIVTEICENDLEQVLMLKKKSNAGASFYESQLYRIATDIYEGLKYLRTQKIIHRDLKLSNIFVSKGVCKIADFGFAQEKEYIFDQFSEQFKDLSVGSPIYMSPQGYIHHIYGCKTDIWAFGVMLYELIEGVTPCYNCRNLDELQRNLTKQLGKTGFSAPGISDELKQLVIECLNVDYKKRIAVEDIQALPWMQKAYKYRKQSLQERKTEMRDQPARKMSLQPLVYQNRQVNRGIRVLEDIGTLKDNRILQTASINDKHQKITNSTKTMHYDLTNYFNTNQHIRTSSPIKFPIVNNPVTKQYSPIPSSQRRPSQHKTPIQQTVTHQQYVTTELSDNWLNNKLITPPKTVQQTNKAISINHLNNQQKHPRYPSSSFTGRKKLQRQSRQSMDTFDNQMKDNKTKRVSLFNQVSQSTNSKTIKDEHIGITDKLIICDSKKLPHRQSDSTSTYLQINASSSNYQIGHRYSTENGNTWIQSRDKQNKQFYKNDYHTTPIKNHPEIQERNNRNHGTFAASPIKDRILIQNDNNGQKTVSKQLSNHIEGNVTKMDQLANSQHQTHLTNCEYRNIARNNHPPKKQKNRQIKTSCQFPKGKEIIRQSKLFGTLNTFKCSNNVKAFGDCDLYYKNDNNPCNRPYLDQPDHHRRDSKHKQIGSLQGNGLHIHGLHQTDSQFNKSSNRSRKDSLWSHHKNVENHRSFNSVKKDMIAPFMKTTKPFSICQVKNQQTTQLLFSNRTIKFNDAIGIIHYCRLCYKLATVLQPQYTPQKHTIRQWSIQILKQLQQNVLSGRITYGKDPINKNTTSDKHKKLQDVTQQYLHKYTLLANQSTTQQSYKSMNFKQASNQIYELYIKAISAYKKHSYQNTSYEYYASICYLCVLEKQTRWLLEYSIEIKKHMNATEIQKILVLKTLEFNRNKVEEYLA